MARARQKKQQPRPLSKKEEAALRAKLPRRGKHHTKMASQAQMIEREIAVSLLFGTGMRDRQIVSTVSKQLGITHGQARNALNKFKASLQTELQVERASGAAMQLHRLHTLTQRAFAANKLSVVATTEGLIMRLLGTAAPVKVELTPDEDYQNAFALYVSRLSPQQLSGYVGEDSSEEVKRLPPPGAVT